MKLFKSQLKERKNLNNFPNLKVFLKGKNVKCPWKRITMRLKKCTMNLRDGLMIFKNYSQLSRLCLFLSLKPLNIKDISSQTSNSFDMDFLKIKSDIFLKARVSKNNFWNQLSEEICSNVRNVALLSYIYFGSTYLCDNIFSHENYKI